MKMVFAHGFPAEMGLDSGAPGDDPLHQNLEATCALVRALLEQPSIPFAAVCDVDRAPSRCRSSSLDGPTHALRYGNDAWRRVSGYAGPPGITLLELFPRLVGPSAAGGRRARLSTAGEPIEVGESPFDNLGSGVPRFYSAAMQPYRDPARGTVTGVVLVGVDLTAQVLARQLLSDVLQTIVWSGITGAAGAAATTAAGSTTPACPSTRATRTAGSRSCTPTICSPAGRRSTRRSRGGARRSSTGGCGGATARTAGTASASRCWTRERDVVRWFGIASDIDDVRRTQEERIELLARERAARAEAEEANRQKDRFLAVVSHELRTPLGALLLWTKVLQDDPIDPDLRRRALASIRECTLAQSRLVDDLLDISRVISGKLYPGPEADRSRRRWCRPASRARAPRPPREG